MATIAADTHLSLHTEQKLDDVLDVQSSAVET